MKRKLRKSFLSSLTIACFLAYIGILTVLNLLAPKASVSWNENRTLAKAPELSVQHIFGGKFDDDFEAWFSDHFVFRDFWIELKSGLRRASLAIENNDIYYAAGDRLVGRFAQVDETTLNSNIDQVNRFAQDHQLRPYVMLVPTAAYGAQDTLPFGSEDIDQPALLAKIYASLNEAEPIDCAMPVDASLYYRTDHHWNEAGAYLGYQAICRSALGKEPEDFVYEQVSDGFTGTMYSKSGAFWTAPDPIVKITPVQPVQAEVTVDDGTVLEGVYSPKRLEEKDRYTYYVDGNHAREDIHTDIGNGKKAILIKDSYSHILVPYLICEYEDLTLIDLRYYHAPASDLLEGDPDVYFIYSLDSFASDPNLAFLR